MAKKIKKEGHPFKHRTYLESVADSIHRTQPTKAILYNTLFEVFSTGSTWGWQIRLEEQKKFKEAMTKRQKESWNSTLDYIDDQIHPQKHKA